MAAGREAGIYLLETGGNPHGRKVRHHYQRNGRGPECCATEAAAGGIG